MSAAHTQMSDKPAIGIIWMLVTMFWFVTLDSTAKYLMQSYPVAQVVWARYFFHSVLVILIMWRQLRSLAVTTSLTHQSLRSFFMFATTVLFFVAVHHLPLATAATMMFLSPIMVTLLSIPLLGERVGIRRWIGILVGFIGALIVVRPGAELDIAVLIVAAAALSNALYQIITRKIRSHDSPMTSLFYSGLVGTLVATTAIPFYWVPIPLNVWPVFLFTGVAGCIGHLCLIRAFNRAPASVIAPFSYTTLLWATLYGFILFGELPDRWTLAGATLIIGSGLYIFYRENTVKKRQETAG